MKKVVIGMSGGVDSSVAAYLLKKDGYEVIGISFRFIDDFNDTDAKNVCEKLGIEHHTIDYRESFKKEVIDTFVNDYKKGITPNPCVMCNRYVKLNYLYEQMKNFNADFIATGHYAKIKGDKLYRSADLNKDQTYFLSLVPLKIISRLIFPLEGIEKTKVREIAEEIGLDVAHKKDSFDVCFITDKFKDFMKENIKSKPGKIIDVETKEIIGEHKGLAFYTIGQRRGLDIGGTEGRLFVVGKDIDENILYVGMGETDYLISDECVLKNINLISYHHPSFATAKFRYRSKELPVIIEYLENEEIKLTYSSGAKGVTPGQTCAIYMGEECIGGGIIKTVRKDNQDLWYLRGINE